MRKEHTLILEVINDEIFILMNEEKSIARLLTRAQFNWLVPMINKKTKTSLSKSMISILDVMREYSQTSLGELIAITNLPRGTVSSTLHKLKTLQMVDMIGRGVYRITENA